MNKKEQYAVWTWADRVSTYGFWGLVLFLVYTVTAYMLFSITSVGRSMHFGLSLEIVSTVFIVFKILGIVGIMLGWFVVEFGNVRHLLLLVTVQAVGVVLLILGNAALVQYIGAGLWGLGYGSAMIIVFSVLSRGRGDASVFAGLFFIVLYKEQTVPLYLAAMMEERVAFMTAASTNAYLGILIFPLFLAIVFLIPVKPDLFGGRPGERLKPLAPQKHNTFTVLLLHFLPFYHVYFLYRTHGYAAYLNPSPVLLSRRGALWLSLLFPLTLPIIVAKLYDVLGEYGEQKGVVLQKKWMMVLLTMLFIPFFPVAVALMQRDLNALILLDE